MQMQLLYNAKRFPRAAINNCNMQIGHIPKSLLGRLFRPEQTQ